MPDYGLCQRQQQISTNTAMTSSPPVSFFFSIGHVAFPDMLSGGIVEFGLADGDGNQEDHFCLLDVEYCFTTRDIVA
jgi:hypothetical protein